MNLYVWMLKDLHFRQNKMQIWFHCITNRDIHHQMLTRDTGHPTPTDRLFLSYILIYIQQDATLRSLFYL
jgi:hypothetical protein